MALIMPEWQAIGLGVWWGGLNPMPVLGFGSGSQSGTQRTWRIRQSCNTLRQEAERAAQQSPVDAALDRQRSSDGLMRSDDGHIAGHSVNANRKPESPNP